MLFFLGILIYNSFGPILYPILTLGFSILVTLITLQTYPQHSILLGASGWAYLLGGCWMALFILLETRISLFSRIFKALAVSLIIFWPQSLVPQVSYRSHAIGFGVGLLLGIFYYFSKRDYFKSFEKFPDPLQEDLYDPEMDHP